MNIPIPPNQLEEPEGQVPLDSPLYIERPPIETDCYQTLVRPTALIRIKAPRQMGKSSLMQRILHSGTQQGYHKACLNFQLADYEFFSNLDQFLQWFCASIAEELGLDDQLEQYWKGVIGSKNKCTKYLQRYLLAQLDSPLVLGLDEVDLIFQHPEIAVDFFGLLRAWHERSKNEPTWQNLRLVISHSKEVYIPLNINQSPFNVGLPVELPELTPEQIQDLIHRHGLEFSEVEFTALFDMIGGHPYLVRMALYQIAKDKITLEQFLETAPTEAGCYYDHLRRHLSNLEKNEELTNILKQVIKSDYPVSIPSAEAFKLRSMGLVKFQGNDVLPLCNLYRIYFREKLGLTTSSKDKDIALAAIMFTDIVDSTSRMERNQRQMLDCIKRDFTVIRDLIRQHNGQELKSMGDGLLLYFSSAVEAVRCGIEMQQALAAAEISPETSLKHRIGIHVGDVFLSGGDVLGIGVNIASRLQSQAMPGEICISQTVYDVVKNHLSLQATYLGERKLKGIESPLPLYRVIP
ncbi:AAA-like domain-containing protein [Planktothrix pseudagardhii]|uniref:Adenylate cyclase n=1 Tax=Planktothrix pseudagardhii TaxID=132604 RepID=A0A9W4CET9_9CYAN|nr:AAA-like domain-containing protein [Planktothrix pseudagardhii]CAD5919007.1 Adenylate cyclase [Planktothrix pseudagardhii]